MSIAITCAHCGKLAAKASGSVNRSRKIGAPLFCSRTCAGLAHRKGRTIDEKRQLKAAYDAEYRERNRDKLKAEKAAYYRRARNPEREREYRKAYMRRHVEYCRRPEYREWKAEYDRQYRAQKDFGPFAAAALVILDLEREIAARATRYEIYSTNGTLNKKLQRRRCYEALCC